jgi:hypothetical protein
LMKHMCLSNKTICVRTQSIWQIISMWELSLLIKGILPETLHFLGRDRLSFFQIGLYSWLKETHISTKKKNLFSRRRI